jgi:hypothetical protein
LTLGGVSTLVSKWLASLGLNPTLVIDEFLMEFDKETSISSDKTQVIMGVQEGIAINTEAAIEARALSMAEKETLDILKRLKYYFPYSLGGNTLLSNIFWEYISVWKNCVSDLRPLYAALNVVDKIPCPHTRQSKLCSIIIL